MEQDWDQGIIDAEGVLRSVGGGETRDIIPRRRRAGLFFVIRAQARWIDNGGPRLLLRPSVGEFAPEIGEVILADAQFQHFFNHGRK